MMEEEDWDAEDSLKKCIYRYILARPFLPGRCRSVRHSQPTTVWRERIEKADQINMERV
jgi:hypothetical protein